jgi:hypothetical protein
MTIIHDNPCVGCITFPMCRSRMPGKVTYSSFMVYVYLNCSIIRNHLLRKRKHYNVTFDYNPTDIDKMVECFRGDNYDIK